MEARNQENIFENFGIGNLLLTALDPLEGQCSRSILYNLIGIAQSMVRVSSLKSGYKWPLCAQLILWLQVEGGKRDGIMPMLYLEYLSRKGFIVLDTDNGKEETVYSLAELLKHYFYINRVIASKNLLKRVMEISALDCLKETGKSFSSLWKRLIDEFPNTAIIQKVDRLNVPDTLKLETLRNMLLASAFNPRGHLRVVK